MDCIAVSAPCGHKRSVIDQGVGGPVYGRNEDAITYEDAVSNVDVKLRNRRRGDEERLLRYRRGLNETTENEG
jgi:hypothetical protein